MSLFNTSKSCIGACVGQGGLPQGAKTPLAPFFADVYLRNRAEDNLAND